MRHKLNTFILKNPPEEKVSKAEKRCASHSVLGECAVVLTSGFCTVATALGASQLICSSATCQYHVNAVARWQVRRK